MARIPLKNVTGLVKFIMARERHREAKDRGHKPVRPDPVISQYRFCNVRRNDDRVTKWIFAKYLDNWRGNRYLWFALVVARLFNNEDTLADIREFVLPFDPKGMELRLKRRVSKGLKNFNAAYIVSTNGISMDKVEYVIQRVLGPLWERRDDLTDATLGGSLAEAHLTLSGEQGLGSFMAAQVLADLKYAFPDMWTDFHTFAASGPGSRRGLNRIMGHPIDAPWKEAEFRKVLGDLRDLVNARLHNMDTLTAQDVQNCLCEFDKYERARLGEGRPKQLYKPKDNELPWE